MDLINEMKYYLQYARESIWDLGREYSGKWFNWEEDYLMMREKAIRYNSDYEECSQKLIDLKKEYKELLKKYNFNKMIINPTSIPMKNITYRRPVLIEKNNFIHVPIDVKTFIQKHYFIYEELKNKDLIYNGKQDLNSIMPEIKNLAKKQYHYDSDQEFGFNEFWLFPFELKERIKRHKGGDCDDWSIYIGSFFATANIPRDKWFVSAGTTRSGFGHATFYVNDGKEWRHFNSTSPNITSKNIKNYPLKNDDNDSIGIHPNKFWFSFNDLISISKFEVPTQKTLFSKKYPNINIGRKIKCFYKF
jgi:hypothetical protein